MDSQTPIIPLLVNDSQMAVQFSERLFNRGIFVSAIRPPTVPRNAARLRLTVMATHTPDDLNYVLDQVKDIGRELKIIKR